MANPLKTLFGALQASTFMSGVSVVYGSEEINTQRYPLPSVVMDPKGGPYQAPGYALAVDPNTEMLWEIQSTIDFWLWNASSDSANQAAIDHVDAVETLRTLFLSALQDQKAQYTDVANVTYGLQYKAVNERWEVVAQNQTSRFNRALVVTVQAWLPVAMAIPTNSEATIATVTITDQFVDGPT